MKTKSPKKSHYLTVRCLSDTAERLDRLSQMERVDGPDLVRFGFEAILNVMEQHGLKAIMELREPGCAVRLVRDPPSSAASPATVGTKKAA